MVTRVPGLATLLRTMTPVYDAVLSVDGALTASVASLVLQAAHPEVQDQVYQELQQAGLAPSGKYQACAMSVYCLDGKHMWQPATLSPVELSSSVIPTSGELQSSSC
jgi:hypothetical protein